MSGTVLLAGAGGTFGPSLARALRTKGWRVVAAGRSVARLKQALADAADEFVEAEFTSATSVEASLASVGALDAVVYSAGSLFLGSFAETTLERFDEAWHVNARGAFLCAKATVPAMLERGRGALLFVGATASLRGGPRSHAFASSKHALRGLTSSLAKELGPRGVHVAHVVVDGKVWGERTSRRFPDVRADQCLDPAAVAQSLVQVMEQPPSAWTFELDLRPRDERWS